MNSGGGCSRFGREQRDVRVRGEHTAGAIWRRERVSCPTREQLGGYLLEAGDPELLDYVRFHLEEIGCPYCQANLDDLRKLQAASSPKASSPKKTKKG